MATFQRQDLGELWQDVVRRVTPRRAYAGYEWHFWLNARASGSEWLEHVGFTRDELLSTQPVIGAARSMTYRSFRRYLSELSPPALDRLAVDFPSFPSEEVEELQHSSYRHLCEMAKGKRVVITGPASYVIGQSRGDFIDSFDLVVRVNHQWPLPPHLHRDLGVRADMLYHCCEGDRPLQPLFESRFDQLQGVCLEHGNVSKQLRAQCHDRGVPCFYISEHYAPVAKAIRSYPNTGLMAIWHLMSLPIRELFVFGMTMQASPYYQDYGSAGSRRVTARSRPKWIWYHSPARQAAFLLDLAARDARLVIDDAAKAVMKSTVTGDQRD